MKKMVSILFVLAISLPAFATDFVHPLDFTGSPEEKNDVIKFIEENVKKTYQQVGMDDPATLRMMENDELDCFKQLTKITNRQLLDDVITQYCNVGMCTYNTILMMYKEQEKASGEKLKW